MGRSGSSLARGPPVGFGPIREPWPGAGGYKYPLSLEGQVFYSHSKPPSLIVTDLSIGEPCRYPPHLALQARYCALTILLIRSDQWRRLWELAPPSLTKIKAQPFTVVMANNNIPTPDPFVLDQIIEDSSREMAHRRRQERTLAGQRRPGHETSQPQRQQIQDTQQAHVLQQVQNVEQTHPEGQAQNGENGQTQPRTEEEQLQIVQETDTRDGQPASSFPHPSDRRRSRSLEQEEPINIPEGADPTAILLLKELQKTNRLIRLQGDGIHDLERRRRYRPPQRRAPSFVFLFLFAVTSEEKPETQPIQVPFPL